MCAIYFIRRAYKREEISKSFNVAAGILFLGLAGRLLLGFYLEIVLIIFLANVSLFIAIFPLGLYLEKIVFRKTKYLISIIAVTMEVVFILISISANFHRPTMYLWVMPPFLIELFILGAGYLILIARSTGAVKTSSILILIGSILIIGSSFIVGYLGPEGQAPIPIMEDYLAILCPLLMIVGALIAAKGFFGYS
jgi:hypothetical protein